MKERQNRISLDNMASSSNSRKYEIIDLDSYMASSSKSNKHNIIDLDSYMASSSNSIKYGIIDLDSYPDIDDLILQATDENYAQELQLQEALIFSASKTNASSSSSQNDASPSSQKSPKYASTSSSTPETSSSKTPLKRKRKMIESEASKLPESFCGICMDTKAPSEMFSNAKVCRHQYCLDCIRSHVSVKINENIAKVKCPDPNCKGLIGPEICRSIVPKEVIDRWEDALCESLILATQKFYCPFKDCSAMLVDEGGVAVTSSECPNCNRLFCVQCKVAWHSGMDCSEFKRLKKNKRIPEDIMLMKLAKNKKWRRCPSCKHYVERMYGCNSIICRCGCNFCYACGRKSCGRMHDFGE